MVSGWLGELDGTCSGVEAGLGYLEAIQSTGGELLDLCVELGQR